jgi:hypothetical protein
MVRMPAGHLPSPPMEAARLFPEPAAGEPYTILIMEMAFSLKIHISNNFGQANLKFYGKKFHSISKIRTSKTAIRIEFRRPGSEISPINMFLCFSEGKLQNTRATQREQCAPSTRKFPAPPQTNKTGSTQ